MITITKNNPKIKINKIYPFRIEGPWEQIIDCNLDDLKVLKNEIERILNQEKERK